MSINYPSQRRACVIGLVSLMGAAHLCPLESADAQQATAPVASFLGHVVDAQGMAPTDPNAPLFRAGTDPLTPLTRSNGDPITLDDFNDATGQAHIAARPGGGTDVNIEVEGLLPDELYSVWGVFFSPEGELVGEGAVSAMGDGSDNFMVADANGTISLDLVQLEGPLTFHGEAPSYAPLSSFLDSNGDLRVHSQYLLAIAYHFNNAPSPPFLNPGPAQTYAVQGLSSFAAVPEPTSIALGLLVAAGLLVIRRKTRSE